ncbi:MAG: phosphatase PAP2 family protein [Lachnospiraceae bacterium]
MKNNNEITSGTDSIFTPTLWKRVATGVLLWIVYGIFFVLDEQLIRPGNPRLHYIHTTLDDKIPFIEWFIFPYLYWILLIVIIWLIMLVKATDEEYRHFCQLTMVGAYIILAFYLIWPSALQLRPETIPDNIAGRIVSWIESTDTPTNVFPSLHVYISLCLYDGIITCKALKGKKGLKLWVLISILLIIVSTVFLKQHSVLDLIAGGVSALIAFTIFYAIPYFRAEKKEAKQQNEF